MLYYYVNLDQKEKKERFYFHLIKTMMTAG